MEKQVAVLQELVVLLTRGDLPVSGQPEGHDLHDLRAPMDDPTRPGVTAEIISVSLETAAEETYDEATAPSNRGARQILNDMTDGNVDPEEQGKFTGPGPGATRTRIWGKKKVYGGEDVGVDDLLTADEKFHDEAIAPSNRGAQQVLNDMGNGNLDPDQQGMFTGPGLGATRTRIGGTTKVNGGKEVDLDDLVYFERPTSTPMNAKISRSKVTGCPLYIFEFGQNRRCIPGTTAISGGLW